MKALVFETPEKPVIVDVPVPGIKDTEVLIKSNTIGICHSDYELLGGRYIVPISYPVTPGHEWCGEIVEVGKSVKGFKKGDRVVGECVVRTPERLHHFGFSMDGADREYFNVNPDWLHKLPDSVDDMRGSLIEPFTCGYYAVMRSGGTNASETVVVSGGGTIGLVTAAAALGMGARVIVADPIKRRRDIAIKLGAEAVDPTDRGADQIKEMTDGKGADLVVECAGHDASLAAVFDYVAQDGRMSMVGINIGRKISAQLGLMQLKNLTIRGCIGSPGVWPAAIRFLERTGIDLSPIQTHKFALTDAVEAFKLGQDPQACIKVTLSTKGLN
ncbi:zinc-dependent alcohol dehydrogenase [Aestuariivirga litoralis]|uniref:zinc-dependent alcohol dehydrogenase n=1 Tax=Aestuariivirga litoralis TaxID=2650924 RepID=UPI0018C671D6|nr:zinc-binding dehydrogenase [Aestuariivirga litoralis]MBG1231063.1 zinc-binding dehydrogenase [Aestuariivirga litoralis]